MSEIDGALERASFTYHAALKAMHHPSYTSEQVLQRARSGRVLTWMREEIGKRAERAVQRAPIAQKVIKTAGPTSTASPVRANLASLLARCRLGDAGSAVDSTCI